MLKLNSLKVRKYKVINGRTFDYLADMFKHQDFGLKKDNLYEILATTFSRPNKKDKMEPNTACMGIRFVDDKYLKISPYPTTTTYKNLKKNSVFSINFVEDVYLYAIAALKDKYTSTGLSKFPTEYYSYYNDIPNLNDSNELEKIFIPYINKAWMCLFGKITDENQILKKDGLGEVIITEFKVEIINFIKLKDSYKYFNRAENLALEIIVLSTRLKVAKEKNNIIQIESIQKKIMENIENIERFGKNDSALKVVDFIKSYLK